MAKRARERSVCESEVFQVSAAHLDQGKSWSLAFISRIFEHVLSASVELRLDDIICKNDRWMNTQRNMAISAYEAPIKYKPSFESNQLNS